jgi:hypothetical protein
MLRQIIAWWRGTRPTLRERQIEAAQIERLAAEVREGETKSSETKVVRRNPA